MSRDVRELLHRAATDPADGLDIDELRRRGRRVEARRRVAVVGSTAVVLLLMAVGVVVGGQQLAGPPDVAVENSPSDSSRPGSVREAVAVEVARAVADQVDASDLPDGEEVETIRDALHQLTPPQGVAQMRPGSWGTVWHEQGQPTRVAASAAVVPVDSEPYCIIVSLASDGTVAGAPATGDPDWGCGESVPTTATNDPLLQHLMSSEPDLGAASDPAAPACRQDPRTRDASDGHVMVFFGCGDSPGDPVQPRVREATADGLAARLDRAVTAFAHGPTAFEQQRGYRSLLPGGPDMLVDTDIAEATAIVSFAPQLPEMHNVGTTGALLPFLDGLRATVFQFDEIDRLRLLIDGTCWQEHPAGQCTFTRVGWQQETHRNGKP